MSVGKKIPLKTIVLCGLLVGTLDILSAFVDYYISTGKTTVEKILYYISTGLVGKDATAGGTGYAVLGLALHYVIAFAFTFFFFWLYSKTDVLAKNRIVTGVVYGLFIWVVMNLIVVRLSYIPTNPISQIKWDKALKGTLILICMIGLPLSFIAYSASWKKE